ncbi:pimeloyl-ACP methyl ester carboxylesterase [Symbiobacterium terraclitae]|uniref:Pimeloyl-ACP methyl ester carboxylesterase n=1 Tax=Symbiobacterium terraclitae TaxID=557451 RepID=A0ABS4JX48_9FIRM|nr:pimeloyl-ACP methyl ester carboxylesterase [Symbiobacterium terraclitae]
MKTYPVSISTETHGLAGSLVLPEGAAAGSPVPGAVIIGGPGPLPLQRRAQDGTKNWPVVWAESLGAAGLACLCYDQRGSGESTGLYHAADWDDLYADAEAAAELLAVQPEVGWTAAVAWADGAGFALRLALEGKVDGLILLAAGALTAGTRYAAQVARLAASRGLSERVVQLRVRQWQAQIADVRRRVEAGEHIAETDVGGRRVVTNLRRFLALTEFDPGALAPHVTVPVLLLHGATDGVVPPEESEVLRDRLGGPVERQVYLEEGHFVYRSARAIADAAAWMRRRGAGVAGE